MTTNDLSSILSDLLRRALEHPGLPARQMLARGCRVDVLVLVDEAGESATFLQLYRTDVYPSRSEWQTVLKHWPYARDLATPYTIFKGKDGGGRYLKGSWPTPAEPEQTELFKQE